MKLLSILAFSTGVLAQYNRCTDTARCNYQVSYTGLTSKENSIFSAQDQFLAHAKVVLATMSIWPAVQRLKLVT